MITRGHWCIHWVPSRTACGWGPGSILIPFKLKLTAMLSSSVIPALSIPLPSTLNRRSVQQLPVSSQSSSRWRSKQIGALVILDKISIINVLGLFSCAIRLQLLTSVFHYPLWLSSPIFPCSSFVVCPAMVTPDQIFIFFFFNIYRHKSLILTQYHLGK